MHPPAREPVSGGAHARMPRVFGRTVGCPRCGRSARITKHGREFAYACDCRFRPGPEDLHRLWLGAGN